MFLSQSFRFSFIFAPLINVHLICTKCVLRKILSVIEGNENEMGMAGDDIAIMI